MEIKKIMEQLKLKYILLKPVHWKDTCRVLFGKRNCDNLDVALKFIVPAPENYYTPKQVAVLLDIGLNEVNILEKLKRGPSIIPLLDYFQITYLSSLVIIFPYVTPLKEFIYTLHEYTTCLCMFQLLKGLEYCHSQKIVHRDLKLSNLLFNNKTKQLMITDFGLATFIKDMYYWEESGTLYYKAPEVLSPSKEIGQGFAVDIWGAGLIFASMLLRNPKNLFQGDSEITVYKNILDSFERGQGKVDITHPNSDAIDLLHHMLIINPIKRITATEALQHKYFTLLEK